MKVQLYTRHNGSREYEKISSRAAFKGGNFPPGTIFVLRYVREGKRVFETLKNCPDLKTAFERRAERELDLIRGKVPIRAPRPVPATIAVAQTPSNAVSGTLMLDEAIDKYLAVIVQTKHANTANGYHYTLKQFHRAIGNKLLTNVSRDDFYRFIGFLKEDGLADRTIANRCGEVTTLLRHFGIKDVTVKVKYTDKKVRAYRPTNWLSCSRLRRRKSGPCFSSSWGPGRGIKRSSSPHGTTSTSRTASSRFTSTRSLALSPRIKRSARFPYTTAW